MYSPTTRLLTVLELLQSHRQMSGTEIARRLEVDVRTVRRYIVMLQDMGIPIEAERGVHGAYQLQRGYKLPPLMFTDAEAVSLTLGLLAIREFRFPVNVAAIEGALAKTERVMPEKLLLQARALQEAITFNVMPPPVRVQNEFLAMLSSAVQQRQQLHLRYLSFHGDESERVFDPYGVVFHEGYWYTSGYCHLRDDLRTFRIDRIVGLEPLECSFERPADFDALAHVLSSLVAIPGPYQVEVLLETTLEHAQQAIPPAVGAVEETKEGLILRRPVRQLEWMAYFLIGLDFPVMVKQPEELREVIRQIARNLLHMAGDDARQYA
jgi:predicted DNA-binding transcriptional regulator YafY